MNITVAWEDVISVIQQISGYLVVIGVALLAMLIFMYWTRDKEKVKRGFLRKQSLVAFITVLVIMLNVIALGPLENLISTVFSDIGDITEESIEESRNIIEEIAAEGIVMTKNEDDALPLDNNNINVFGWASTNPVYGGPGSGAIDTSTAVDLLGGLENAGFNINTELSEMYSTYRSDRPAVTINDGQDWTLPEPPVAQYSDEVINNAQEFSDTAVVVIGRIGGEGADLPHDMGAVVDGSWAELGSKYINASYNHNSTDYPDYTDGQTYLELSQTELDLINMVTNNFEDVIVVYNGSNTFELGWTDEYEEIKSVLLVGGAGVTGFNALGQILSGEVNPSGKVADTWVHNLTETPYYNNIGYFAHTNTDDVSAAAQEHWPRADGYSSFVDYVEGLYVGYRFYETAAEEGLIDYDSTVHYPFGYGLSYTEFSQEMEPVLLEDETVTVEVTVTNTGDVAGKEVVQIYHTPPYVNGGIEKASVNLIEFDKTDMLAPGESQTLTLSFTLEEMASYDSSGDGNYILESGDYEISLRSDSNTVIDDQTFTISEDIIYDEFNPRSTDEVVATNQLQFAEGNVEYLSREDGFSNYEEATSAPTDFESGDEYELLANGTYDPTDYNNPDDEMPTLETDNGLEAYDLRGRDYDDPMWDDLLDQISVDEMVELIAFGGHGTVSVDSINLPSTVKTDGPAGLNSPTVGAFGTGYVSEIIIAQTWNVDLAYAASEGITNEFRDANIDGWYGPSMNLHRNAFNGRNFEYYSEDPILSAKMAVSQTQAAYDNNVTPYLKHFAFNEQETNRNALLTTWLPEQAGRELYLKPFEYTVKANDGSSLALMSVFNYIGTEWGGSSSELLNNILRDEWGFQGMVLTDYFGNYGYMDADRAIRGGSDLMLGTAGNDAILTDQSSPTSILAMRQSTKNILYTLVNGGMYEDYEPNAIPNWKRTLFIVNIVFIIALVGIEIVLIRNYRRDMEA